MKTLFGASTTGVGVAAAGIGSRDGAPNVKGVPLDGAPGFAGFVAGGCSAGRLGVVAITDATGFAGAPNVKDGARDGVVAVGFSASFGITGGTPRVEEGAAESGVGVGNADTGRDGEVNSDGVAEAVFATPGSGTSTGFGCSIAGGVSNEGCVTIAAGCKKREEFLVKKLGMPEVVGAVLGAGVAVAGRVRASGTIFTVSGVGGMSDIVGGAGAGVGGTGIGAVFAIIAAGGAGAGAGTGAGLVRENGSEAIGGSFACARSCVNVAYEM